MHRIDSSTAAAALPTPAGPGPKPNGFFTNGNPGMLIPPTIGDQDFWNAVQEEIANAILLSNITPLNKADRTQLYQAIRQRGFLGGMQVFTGGSGNFTVPSNVYLLKYRIWGGGGGGGGSNGAPSAGGGGGGAGYCEGFLAVTPGALEPYVVGAAGGGGSGGPGGAGGGTGSNSTFGPATAGFGSGGGWGNAGSGSSGNPGGGVGGTFNLLGDPGGIGYPAGGSVFVTGTGGATYQFPNHPNASDLTGTGSSGAYPGVGGDGGLNGGHGGDGALGMLILEW